MGLINLLNKAKLGRHISKAFDNPELLKDSRWWATLFKAIYDVKELRQMLKGYKTYLVAVLTGAVQILHSLGYIDANTYQMLLGLLAAGGTATVAAKINRINEQINGR